MIWVWYIDIGGVEYVYNLLNKKEEYYCKLFDLVMMFDVDVLCVLED